jgi:hypothetical protein
MRLIGRMAMQNKDIRRLFFSTAWDCVSRNFLALRYILFMSALYLHLGPFAGYVRACAQQQVMAIDRKMRKFVTGSAPTVHIEQV